MQGPLNPQAPSSRAPCRAGTRLPTWAGSAAMVVAPPLSVGGLNADVPVFPPAAGALALVASLLLWRLSGNRRRWLPTPFAHLAFRMVVLAAAVGLTAKCVNESGAALQAAGSGVNFTPISGIATSFPYDRTRNPMYTGLVFLAMPTMAVLFDTAWVVLPSAGLFFYLDKVVIPSEEKLLTT
mmetsp:Transcript_66782/g.184176  ORF Transcript_66782/g.184176 Transcript_66782/m.184176 type:complete len:182 (-) Transcript_66782:111-656(-)